jgi:MoxR-like ATPase
MTMSNKVEFLDPQQVQRALAICWQARVPVNLVGAPGVGKTSAVEAFVARVRTINPSFGYWPCLLAMKGPEDFGLPAPDGGKLKYLMPPDLPLGDSKAEGLVFLDEWDRCPDPAVQNAAMQLTLGGHFHGHVMSPNVWTVLAMNGTSDIHTSPVSEAARTRMIHLYVGTSAPGYWTGWSSWAADSDVPASVAGFVMSRADLIRKEEEFEELAAFNPRTGGALLARIEAVMATTKIKHNDIALALFAGTIGKAAAMEYMAYRRVHADLPPVADILRDPTGTTIPTAAGTLFMLAMMLTRALDGNGMAKKILTYVARWPEEPAAFAANLIRRKQPTVLGTPEFAKWADVNLT